MEEIGSQLYEYLFILKGGGLEYILLMIFFSIFFLPCSQLSVISGMLLGPLLGSVTNVLASIVSFSLTFFLAKRYGSTLKVKFKYFDQLTEKLSSGKTINFSSSWGSLLLFYVNPLLPGSSMGYLFGLSSAEYKPLIYKAVVLVITPCVVYAAAGSVFANQLISGQGIYALMGLLIFVICFKNVYSFIMKKVKSKYD